MTVKINKIRYDFKNIKKMLSGAEGRSDFVTSVLYGLQNWVLRLVDFRTFHAT